METSARRTFRLPIRIALYLVVIALAFFLRGVTHNRGLGFHFPAESDTVTTIKLAGSNLAPALISQLVADYRRDYSEHHILFENGGTARAIEAIANAQAAVGLLYRPPTQFEQDAVQTARKDTLEYFPIALGGIALLVNTASSLDSLTVDDVAALASDAGDPSRPIYVPDPSQGLWEAFRAAVGVPPEAPEPPSLSPLRDEGAVLQAITADARGIGLASTLAIGIPDSLGRFRALKIRADGAASAVAPEYARIAYGEYPLLHYLYIAQLPHRSLRGSMFVAHVISDRGQRQVEKAGFLPARMPLREIRLTRSPIPTPTRP